MRCGHTRRLALVLLFALPGITAPWEKSKAAYYLFKTEDGLPVIFEDK